MRKARASANANIALVKYWGKRNPALNLPAEGSLSLTLKGLATTTEVVFDPELERDSLHIDGNEEPTTRLTPWLDTVRKLGDTQDRARITSRNLMPTASGLASSASAYAALALAATSALGLELAPAKLSELARQGSGSAARSIFGGFVLMHRGEKSDGTDAIAEPLDDAEWGVRMVIGIVGGGARKAVSSRDAMEHCADTSPLYRGWLDSVSGDIAAAKSAILHRDLKALGAVTEYSAMAMHAAAMASRPPVRYWQPATLELLDTARMLRESGLHAYPTMDAGPHVKVLTSDSQAETVRQALAATPGCTDTLVCEPGGGANVVSDSEKI